MTVVPGLTPRSRRLLALILGIGTMSHVLHYTIISAFSNQQLEEPPTNQQSGNFPHFQSHVQDALQASDQGHSKAIKGVYSSKLQDRSLKGVYSRWVSDKLWNATQLHVEKLSSQRNNTASVINTWSTSFCQGISKPKEVARVKENLERWQEVVAGKSYVFSAWYDGRVTKRRVIRVVGSEDIRAEAKPFFCRMWYTHSPHPHIVPVSAEIVPETHNKR